MKIINFSNFINESLGLSKNVMDQAEKFFDIINSDKSKFMFNFEYDLNGKKHPIKIKIDSKFDLAGQFIPDETPPTIITRDRLNFGTLAHELKHADRFFRIGRKAYEEDFSKLYSITADKKEISLLPYKFRNLFFLFYFLQKEEFEAQFHSDYVFFKEQVVEKKLTDKKEILELWKKNSKDFLAYAIFSGSLTQGKLKTGTQGNIQMFIPKEQKPFKFSNWADNKIVDSIIWTLLQDKKDIEVEEGIISKILKIFVPEHILSSFEKGVPKKYQEMVDRYKIKLEKLTNRKMDMYSRKYMRIPLKVIDEVKLKF